MEVAKHSLSAIGYYELHQLADVLGQRDRLFWVQLGLFPIVMNKLFLLLLVAIPITFYVLKKVFRKIVYSPRIQLLGQYVDRVNTSEKTIALTYDDGPNPPYTHELLDVLSRHQVKATFCVLGKQVEQYPETLKSIVAEGHEVVNHSYSHPQMIWKSPAFIRSEIQKTDRLLHELGVKGDINFRPPFGMKFLLLPYVLNRLKKVSVLWNIDAKDFQTSNPHTIVDTVLSQVVPGSIVLLHDALDDLKGDRSGTILATEILIEKLRSQGYQFKTVTELLALKK
jgi:peptidoglycan-N-acetylglucosamine deacetylase